MFKVNEYFGGKVKSIAFTSVEGPATIGVIAAGEYAFGTSTVEIMRVICGILQVMQPGQNTWTSYKPGTSFEVAANVTFKVKAEQEVAYLCLYK